jgi:hypothetical protein
MGPNANKPNQVIGSFCSNGTIQPQDAVKSNSKKAELKSGTGNFCSFDFSTRVKYSEYEIFFRCHIQKSLFLCHCQ